MTSILPSVVQIFHENLFSCRCLAVKYLALLQFIMLNPMFLRSASNLCAIGEQIENIGSAYGDFLRNQ